VQARVIALALCCLALLARPAAATPAQELEEARALFKNKDFSNAIPKLNYLLYPTPRLAQTDDLVEAHVLLGVCSFESGDHKQARREFEDALELNTELKLDPVVFSTDAVDFFEEVKTEVKEREERDAQARDLARKNEELQAKLDSLRIIETHSYGTNFVPFGAGQFQNGERTKGLLFALAEGITGGASAALFLYIYGQYGFATSIDPRDATTVLHLQEAEIATGSVCIGIMIWGVIDSLIHYKHTIQLAPDKRYLQQFLPEPEVSPTPGGASLSLRWEL
jgi:tetratricopeptide (TPR) repeat protein